MKSQIFLSATQGGVYTYDVDTNQLSRLGTSNIFFTDIAISQGGQLYGVTFGALYKINKSTGATEFVANLGTGSVNAFTVDMYGRAYVADTSGRIYSLNLTTGDTDLITSVGVGSSGDLTEHNGRILFSTTAESLLELSRTTFNEVSALNHGVANVYGLTSDENGLLAFAGDDVYRVNLSTGNFTYLHDLGSITVGGAATTGMGYNGYVIRGNNTSQTLTASSLNDVLYGFAGNDVINGRSGNDFLFGHSGNDTLVGGAGRDRLDGGTGTDRASYANATAGVTASLANASINTGDAKGDVYVSIERLTGSSHADKLTGNGGTNLLIGGSGNDVLNGGSGNDTIYGGGGADDLTGGAGADTFVFKARADTTVSTTGRDTIFDFSGTGGDRIDLSDIDANASASGNQAFTYLGTAAFTGKAGELRTVKQASDTYVYGDTNGDKTADFAVHLDDAISLSKGYFVL